MNYRKIYIWLINRALKEKRKRILFQHVEHHILPKSLFPLWKDRKNNKVLLTHREHFFCHQLLDKIYPEEKMFLALWRISNDKQHKVSSREYEKLRIKFLILNSRRHKGNKYLLNKKWSEERKKEHSTLLKGIKKSLVMRQKLSETRKICQLGKNNPCYGMHWYTNGIINIKTYEQPENFWPGRCWTKQQCKNMGESRLGKKRGKYKERYRNITI